MTNTTTLLEKLTREIEIATLTRLYRQAKGKKISLETLGKPFGIPKQTLHLNLKRQDSAVEPQEAPLPPTKQIDPQD